MGLALQHGAALSREHGAYALAGEDERSRDPVPGDLMTGRTNCHYVFMMSDLVRGRYDRVHVFLSIDGRHLNRHDCWISRDETYLFLGQVGRFADGTPTEYGLFLTPYGVCMSAMNMLKRV